MSSYYTNRLNLLNQSALATDASHASLMVLGLLLAPETLGVGTLVVWGITFAADKALDANMDSDIEALTAEMLGDEECKDEDDDDDDDPPDPDEPDDPDRPDDDDLADPVWIHDPSGYVYEAVASNRVRGVTATLRSGATDAGPWTTWDADWFGQTNPLVTDGEGRYGWHVPEGWWQVDYSKDGYEPASSAVLRVLPPHFDVNVGLVSYAAPAVASVVATGEDASAIDVEFDRYMRLDAAGAITASDGDGAAIAGDVVALDGEASPAGPTYARRFRLVPSAALEPGSTVEVTVDEAASSYADRPMTATVLRTVEVVEPTPPPPVYEPLTTSKVASAPSVGAGGTVGYAITIANPNDAAIPLATVSDTLPEGFAVVAGSTTGVTSADPTVDGRTLSWPVDAPVPAGGTVELGFTATVSRAAGTYPNEAGGSAVGADVTATGPTAVVTVERLTTALTAEPVLASLAGTPRVTAGTLSATLTSSGAPVPGQVVRFTVGGAEACTAMTDAAGRAACGAATDTIRAAAAQGYRAEFAGDETYAPASADGAVIATPAGRSSMP